MKYEAYYSGCVSSMYTNHSTHLHQSSPMITAATTAITMRMRKIRPPIIAYVLTPSDVGTVGTDEVGKAGPIGINKDMQCSIIIVTYVRS